MKRSHVPQMGRGVPGLVRVAVGEGVLLFSEACDQWNTAEADVLLADGIAGRTKMGSRPGDERAAARCCTSVAPARGPASGVAPSAAPPVRVYRSHRRQPDTRLPPHPTPPLFGAKFFHCTGHCAGRTFFGKKTLAGHCLVTPNHQNMFRIYTTNKPYVIRDMSYPSWYMHANTAEGS